ncbi:hypothetical protein HYS92_02105 [Candidatus Daviesbacteria bacterium]|nr:hypothetical protein [Candidatus Daviesbacteria bacterium]
MDYDFISSSEEKLTSKKNIATFLILAIITLAIPLGVRMVQTQQAILKSKAAGTEMAFPDLKQNNEGNFESTTGSVKVQLNSPLGPPVPKTQTR